MARLSVGAALPGAVLVAVALVLLTAGTALSRMPEEPATTPSVGALPQPVTPQATTGEIDAEAPPPRQVTIERLGIDSELTGLAVQPDGALQVPGDPDVVGWYRSGTVPGDTGPAVLVGHVDSYEGGAVFFRLRELQPGDRVSVARVDGSVVEFEVYGLETVAKDAFPTDRVYGPTPGPELRLVTCGGSFDRRSRHYTENVIAYARQVPAPVTS